MSTSETTPSNHFIYLTRILLFTLGTILLSACGNSDRDDPENNDDYLITPVAITACNGRGPGTEDCHFRLVWNPRECDQDHPFSRLVVFWAGGNQTCDDVDINNQGDFDPLLNNYVDRGFIAACAQPYTTGEEGGAYSYHMEWDRMHYLMQRVRSQVSEIWDGTHLLISGASHGGTAPMVAIANQRALQDHGSVWTGSTHTAVIMYDGISNPRTLEEWAGSQAVGSGCGPFHSRWVGRYGDGAPLLHSCTNDACYCTSPAHLSDWVADTLTPGTIDPTSPYSCDDFIQNGKQTLYRFVSCSGETNAQKCSAVSGDIVPDAQQSEIYEALQECNDINASYVRYDCPHILCGGFKAQRATSGLLI